MITINEIAKRANVSRTTVSRVLNDSGFVSEELKEKVLKVIKETGYVPSQYAQSLRTKKTKVIGIILPKITTETSGQIVMGIDEILSEEGYQILLANTNELLDKEIESLRLLASRRVDGIVLVATNVDPLLVKEIESLNIPFIAVGQEFPNATCVVYDNYSAAKNLTDYLIQKGRSRIAFIGVSESDISVGIHRKQGYLNSLKDNGIEVNPSLMAVGRFHTDSGYYGMKQIIENNDTTPDGLFAVTDRLAIGAMKYLKEKGLSIPKDIIVAGIGMSEMAKYVTPALTAVEYDYRSTGREVGTELLSQIERENKVYKKIILSHRLVEREST